MGSKITCEKVEAFTRSVKEVLHGSNRALTKQVLFAIVAKIEVTDTTVRIVGDAEHLSSLAAEESDPADGPAPMSTCELACESVAGLSFFQQRGLQC